MAGAEQQPTEKPLVALVDVSDIVANWQAPENAATYASLYQKSFICILGKVAPGTVTEEEWELLQPLFGLVRQISKSLFYTPKVNLTYGEGAVSEIHADTAKDHFARANLVLPAPLMVSDEDAPSDSTTIFYRDYRSNRTTEFHVDLHGQLKFEKEPPGQASIDFGLSQYPFSAQKTSIAVWTSSTSHSGPWSCPHNRKLLVFDILGSEATDLTRLTKGFGPERNCTIIDSRPTTPATLDTPRPATRLFR